MMADAAVGQDGVETPSDGSGSPNLTTNPMDASGVQELLGEPVEDVLELPPGENCNARRTDDGRFQGYCQNRAGKGTDHVGRGRCKFHGGLAGAPEGEANGAYRHGAYSRLFRRDFTSSEAACAAELVVLLKTKEDTIEAACEAYAEAVLKYKRSNDVRFLREARQLATTFNLIPTAGTDDGSKRGQSGIEVVSQAVRQGGAT